MVGAGGRFWLGARSAVSSVLLRSLARPGRLV
jgi:hypothetical protein